MAVKTYTVLSPLNHDGKPYAPGASIELDPAAARPLVEVGTIDASRAEVVPIGGKDAKPKGKGGKAEDAV